jgi:hypothetical protein
MALDNDPRNGKQDAATITITAGAEREDSPGLPAVFDRLEPAEAALAVRPAEYGRPGSGTGPRYPQGADSSVHRAPRSALVAPPGPEVGGCAADDATADRCECAEDAEGDFGDSPGGHVTLPPPPPDPLRDRLAAIFGGSPGGTEKRAALDSAATSVRAGARGLGDRHPACLPPHPRRERNRGNGGGNGHAG